MKFVQIHTTHTHKHAPTEREKRRFIYSWQRDERLNRCFRLYPSFKRI